MKYSDVINIINEIEDKFPVNKWVIDKIHIWPLIRIELQFKLYYSQLSKPKKTIKLIRYIIRFNQTVKNFFKYAYAYMADFRHNATIDGPVDVVFLANSRYSTLLKGLYYDRICEPFIDVFQNINMKTLTLEYRYFIPRHRPSVFITHWIDYSGIKNMFLRKKPKPENEKLESFYDFIKILESKNYGIINPNIQDLRYQVKMILEISRYFKKIFNKVKPSVAFIANYYSSIGFAFNHACRQAGIPSVDLPHGMVGEYHLAYGQWNKVPEGGYELLPLVFWCWSKEEANAILRWNKFVSSFHRPFVGGNLWLNLWRDQNKDIVKYYDNQIMQMKVNTKKSVFILYTFDKDYGIPEWIFNVIKLYSESFHWWIRIHPSQTTEREVVRGFLKKHNITNFELDLPTVFPLTALLRHADIHITASSSTVIEAEYFGVPSIVTHEDGITFYAKQIASGMAVPAYTTEELLKAIELQLSKKNKMQQQDKKPPDDNLNIIKEFLATIK